MSAAMRIPSRIGIMTLRSMMAIEASSFSTRQRSALASSVSGAPLWAGAVMVTAAASAAVSRTVVKPLGMVPKDSSDYQLWGHEKK